MAYDLLSEPWIPVLDAGTDLDTAPDAPVRRRLVGLREAIARAHEIREVAGDTPLETIALNRLLLALFLDVHDLSADGGPWCALWDAGRTDADALGAYLDTHCDRFDLLHPERPFYQTAQPLARDATTLSQLRHAESAGNNGTLFGHEMDDQDRRLSLAEAARSVVAYQAFGLGGLAGSAATGGRLPAFRHAPLVSGAVFWIRGRSLFQALLLNAPPTDDVWIGAGNDEPAWGRDRPTSRSRPPEGLLDLLTWQARHVTLVLESRQAGAVNGPEPAAAGVYIANAESIDHDGVVDPMMARVMSKKKGVFPYGLRSERGVWRDADVLHHAASPDAEGAPQTFRELAALALEDDRLRGLVAVWTADVFGIENDKSKMLRWRHARVPVYPALLGDPVRLAALRAALEDADEQATTGKHNLRFATRTVAEYLLSPPPPGAKPDATP
ncbi:type I-E CRISPR-associated protein Cse1/CasA, partial [Rubrivirga sp.]|uniref:type I-E CRISPR-associated protein Cse1/CasA n=1 Tax=Rubrivirga sp. TaxID=1885344 RepID=UPI003C70D893